MKWAKVASIRVRKPTEDQWQWRKNKVLEMEDGPLKYQIAAIVFWDWIPENSRLDEDYDRLMGMKWEDNIPREKLIEALRSLGYPKEMAENRLIPEDYMERCREQQRASQKIRDQRRKERKHAL